MGMLNARGSRKLRLILYRRGKSGGQVRDEYRDEFDPGRGGFGRAYADEYD
jgi:hypothetical protein